MNFSELHPWDLDYGEAVALQEKLRGKLDLRTKKRKINVVAGADVSYIKRGDFFFSGVVVMDIRSFEILETAESHQKVDFPYIPGLLSFREGPVLLNAFRRLKIVPDAVIFDGQGIAHQRGFGIASHMGLILNIPSVGCAKSRLVGEFGEVETKKGSITPLVYNDNKVGYVVRTKDNVKPVFISPGNLMSHEDGVELIISATGKYRLPEPIRAAHNLVNRSRKKFMEEEAGRAKI